MQTGGPVTIVLNTLSLFDAFLTVTLSTCASQDVSDDARHAWRIGDDVVLLFETHGTVLFAEIGKELVRNKPSTG